MVKKKVRNQIAKRTPNQGCQEGHPQHPLKCPKKLNVF
jgi:hypothetical protein